MKVNLNRERSMRNLGFKTPCDTTEYMNDFHGAEPEGGYTEEYYLYALNSMINKWGKYGDLEESRKKLGFPILQESDESVDAYLGKFTLENLMHSLVQDFNKEGYQAVLDYLIGIMNTHHDAWEGVWTDAMTDRLFADINAGNFTPSEHDIKKWESCTPARVMRMIANDNKTFRGACIQIESETGEKYNTIMNRLINLVDKKHMVRIPNTDIDVEVLVDASWTSFKKSYNRWNELCRANGKTVKTRPYGQRNTIKFS